MNRNQKIKINCSKSQNKCMVIHGVKQGQYPFRLSDLKYVRPIRVHVGRGYSYNIQFEFKNARPFKLYQPYPINDKKLLNQILDALDSYFKSNEDEFSYESSDKIAFGYFDFILAMALILCLATIAAISKKQEIYLSNNNIICIRHLLLFKKPKEQVINLDNIKHFYIYCPTMTKYAACISVVYYIGMALKKPSSKESVMLIHNFRTKKDVQALVDKLNSLIKDDQNKSAD